MLLTTPANAAPAAASACGWSVPGELLLLIGLARLLCGAVGGEDAGELLVADGSVYDGDLADVSARCSVDVKVACPFASGLDASKSRIGPS
jgi:hypothetical protein